MVTAAADTLAGLVTLNVFAPVSNVTVQANITDPVEFNDTVRLSCSASGSVPSYRWLNDSSEVTAGQRFQLSEDNRTLTISSVLRSDRGPLYCFVSNSFSNATSQPVYLNVLSPPGGGGGGGGSLSRGAIAGIVIAVLVAVGLIVGLVYFLMTRQGSSPRETTNSSVMYENSEGLKDHMMYMNLPAGHQKKAAQPSPAAPESTYTSLQFPDNSTYGNLNRS
ncbi:carcinoembryonic antigen-related cell adhesion molecule 1-like [Lepisosteus oculatus]|uniref:carcinoembryonic antigen-related cell adhesion molecule 1-like n=1 Tax=Lepisosteus oculatus TaxID=7918 RepID=UPI00371C8A60